MCGMITGEQIRAALGAMRWSRRILSEKSGVPERTIQRMAEASGIPNTNALHLAAVQKAFEAGEGEVFVEFTSDNGIRHVLRPTAANERVSPGTGTVPRLNELKRRDRK